MIRLALLMPVLLLAACAITPTSRIERDPTAFAALPPEQQQKVREGQIGIGFEPNAVRLAYGEPDRILAMHPPCCACPLCPVIATAVDPFCIVYPVGAVKRSRRSGCVNRLPSITPTGARGQLMTWVASSLTTGRTYLMTT